MKESLQHFRRVFIRVESDLVGCMVGGVACKFCGSELLFGSLAFLKHVAGWVRRMIFRSSRVVLSFDGLRSI